MDNDRREIDRCGRPDEKRQKEDRSGREEEGKDRGARIRGEPEHRHGEDRRRGDDKAGRESSSVHHRQREEGRHRHRRSRSRSRSRSPRRRSHHHRSRRHVDGSGSSSGGESEDGRSRHSHREHGRRHERHGHRRQGESERDRERRHERRHDGETREERKERKQRKKDKKLAQQKSKAGAITEFGKHGIIAEADVTSRLTMEFRQWLVEERQINPETISRANERKEMATFIEDFNTATLPEEKYYNLDAHERKMAMIRSGELLEEDVGYDPLADERAAKASFKSQQRAAEGAGQTSASAWQSKEQLEELRRVQKERVEAVKMRQMGMQTSATMGIRMDGTQFDKR